MKGHKNSKGEKAEWVIVSHETGKILSSHKSKEKAKEHMRQMKIFKENTMNLTEARKILNDNGYIITDGYVKESLDFLKNNGYLITEAEEVEAEESFEEIKQELNDKDSLKEVINALNTMKPEQRKILRQGFGDGAKGEKASATMANIKCTELIPTQNEIDINKSLAFPLTLGACKKDDEDPEKTAQNTAATLKETLNGGTIMIGDLPIVVWDDGSTKYIIDGHHRWSQTYMINPEASVKCYSFTKVPADTENAIDVLRDFQGAVAVTHPNDKLKLATVNGENLIGMAPEKVKQYVLDNIVDGAVKIWQDIKGEEWDKNKIAEDIANNGSKMTAKNKPVNGAPNRGEMPQTDKDVLKMAAAKLTDI